MRLDSARALKAELLTAATAGAALASEIAIGPATGVSSAATARARRVAVAYGTLAIGVSRQGRGQYRLAVRQQKRSSAVEAMTEKIRQRASGEVEVRYIGRVVKLAAGPTSPLFYRRQRRPLRIGSSISDVQDDFLTAGTLGCFVVGRKAPHYISLLTNNHVIAGENANPAGAPVVQQGTLDDGGHPDDQIGTLGRFIRLRTDGPNHLDAALANLHDEIEFDPRQIGSRGNLKGLGDVSQLAERAIVFKVGRTTGQTKGRITAFEVDQVDVEYDLGDLRFNGQIEIEGTGQRAFSDSGDSGSLIVDENLRGIGLLFAGGVEGGANGRGLTYANVLSDVLDALRVDLES